MIVVSPAAPAHLDAAAALLAGTFRTDGAMGSFFRSPAHEREARLTHLFRAMLAQGLRAGAVDVARVEGSPEIVGVATWSAPNPAAPGFVEAARDLAHYLRAFGWRDLRWAARREQAMRELHPREPHWYLAAIGSHAAGRGQGIGSALLRHRLAVIDGSAVPAPAYLEASTERSAALYARFGFVASERLTGLGPDTRPVAMWRAAVTARPLVPQS